MTTPTWIPSFDVDTSNVGLLLGMREAGVLRVGQLSLDEDGPLRRAISEVCADILSEAEGREGAPWTAESGWERDEYRVVQHHQLALDSEVMQVLDQVQYPVMRPQEISSASVVFYAFILGEPAAPSRPDSRLLLLKKRDPRGGFGRKVVAVLTDALRKLDEAVVTFDRSADLLFAPGRGIVALNALPFESLFTDSPDLIERSPAVATAVAERLPLNAQSKTRFTRVGARKARVRRKLLMLHSATHLDTLTPTALRRELRRQSLVVSDFMDGNEINLTTDARVETLVKVLNEDLMTGPLSNKAFEIDRKTGI